MEFFGKSQVFANSEMKIVAEKRPKKPELCQIRLTHCFNLLSNIWLKCGARFDPQAEIDQKP